MATVRGAYPQFLRSGERLFPVLKKIFAQAREEILIAVYTFTDDAVGRDFLVSLKEAVARGVKVRMIFDDFGTRNAKSVKRKLEAAGVEAIDFRPRGLSFWLHPLDDLCRLHARLFLIDRQILGVGGMSLGRVSMARNDFFMLTRVSQSQGVVKYFDRLVSFASSPNLPRLFAGNHFDLELDGGIQGLLSGPNLHYQSYHRWLSKLLPRVQKRLIIASPFFLPDREIMKTLLALQARGVKVEIITPLRTDKPFYDRLRALPLPTLVTKGIKWYRTPNYFHGKFLLADEVWSAGSVNFDIISMKRNFEFNLWGTSGDTLRYLEAYASDLKKRAYLKTSYLTPTFVRMFSGVFYRTTEFFLSLT